MDTRIVNHIEVALDFEFFLQVAFTLVVDVVGDDAMGLVLVNLIAKAERLDYCQPEFDVAFDEIVRALVQTDLRFKVRALCPVEFRIEEGVDKRALANSRFALNTNRRDVRDERQTSTITPTALPIQRMLNVNPSLIDLATI